MTKRSRLDKVSNELVQELVELIHQQDHDGFKAWVTRNGFSEDLLHDVIGLAEVHLNSGVYIGDHDEIADEKLFLFINHCLSILPYLPLSKVGNQLKAPRKNTCPQGYFEPVATKIIEYLVNTHPDKYNGEWIVSDKEKSLIRELFFILEPEFKIIDYTGVSLANEFLSRTGIRLTPRQFNTIKKYSRRDGDLKFFLSKHTNFY